MQQSPEGPAGPNYVPPNRQGYIRGIIIAQDTFNNRRAHESYNYTYYSQTPCLVNYLGSSVLWLSINRTSEPYYFTSLSSITLQIDTSTSPPTILTAEASVLYATRVDNSLLVYDQYFDINDS